MAVQQPSWQRLVAPKGAGQAILSLQSGLATSATMRRRKRFRRLYPLLWRQEWLEQALKAVLDNKGSETPGIDGKRGSALRDPTMKTRFITELQRELKRCGQRKYKPSPVLRAYIPKASGDVRPIGIPTLKDRVVQAALKMILEPIFEADFLPNSNGFRLERSTLECVLPAYRYGDRMQGYDWVIEGDIKGCFDNINHRILMKTIRQRIADRRILRLIQSLLKAPVLEHGHLIRTVKGTPQGGVLSPLLANIYLNKLDQFWLENWGKQTACQRNRKRKRGEASCVLFRYADDFIFLAKGKRDGVERIKRSITTFFKDYLRLELSKDKTRVVPLKEGFKFLGFQIKRERLGHFSSVRIRPTQRNVARLTAKLQGMLGRRAMADQPVMKILALNRVLRGWANYYRYVNANQQYYNMDGLVNYLFRDWYWKRAGKRLTGEIVLEGRTADGKSFQAKLFKMTSRPSEAISGSPMNPLFWKYRHIENPYLKGFETCITDEDTPFVDAREIHPIAQEYGDTYLENRILAFDKDGNHCTTPGCNERVKLEAHHIEPVPKNPNFDPKWVHRVENLVTKCTTCHKKIHRCSRR